MKNEVLQIRLDSLTKEQFLRACSAEQKTATEVITDAIKSYIYLYTMKRIIKEEK